MVVFVVKKNTVYTRNEIRAISIPHASLLSVGGKLSKHVDLKVTFFVKLLVQVQPSEALT